ncbi:hypothetical protein [Streptomyces sp. NPDC054975]
MILSAPDPQDGRGWILVGARSGKILRGQITVRGTEVSAPGPRAVHAMLTALNPRTGGA